MIHRKKILVVEDSKINIEILATLLRENGYEFMAVESGEEALKKTPEFLPDLILLDVVLPQMSGHQVCTKLKEDPQLKEIPIIFLTALSKVEDIKHGFEIGAVDYIPKPFNNIEVLSRVKNHLRLKESLEMTKKAKELAENATTLKNKFLSLVAHDMRGPLTNIQLYLDLFKESIPQEKKKYMDNCEATIVHLSELLNTLLSLNKFQGGKINLTKLNFNLHSLVLKHLSHFSMSAEKKGIVMRSEIDPSIEIFADAVFLGEVISNLISNAIKYCKSGDSIVATYNTSTKVLSIKDSGPGIQEEVIKQIKSSGFATSTKGSSGEKGHGLGLSLCYEIIKAHGGELEVESTLGKGSNFLISLP